MAADHTYDIVFKIGSVPTYWWILLAPLPGLVLGAVLVWLSRRRMLRWLGWFFGIVSVAWAVVAGVVVFREWRAVQTTFQQGKFSVVEGRVEDFQPMPPNGKGRETFRVANVSFSISDFDLTSGFHTTTYYNGPIRAGRKVRIAYVPYGGTNVILRLEVAQEPQR